MQRFNSNGNDPWFIRLRAQPQAKLRLFCFPYSGAGASLFYPWMDIMPGNVELIAVQYPGRENRIGEAPIQQLAPLLDHLVIAIQSYLDKPLAFFGHSLGALVAFELARMLAGENGLHLVHLFVSSCYAPQIPDPSEQIYALPEADFKEKLGGLNGMPAEVLGNKELMSLLLPILRADFEICETYRYQDASPLGCDLTAMGGLRDIHVPRRSLEAWQAQSTGAFTVRMFPGDHFYLNQDRMLLLQVIARTLAGVYA
jgi:medium-chain acyl-[acyl-carrier-protein] hydrolase